MKRILFSSTGILHAAVMLPILLFGCGKTPSAADSTKTNNAATIPHKTHSKTMAANKSQDSETVSNRAPDLKSPDKKPAAKPKPAPAFQYALPPKQAHEGWIKLFDGHSLFGWTANSNANWHIEKGVLTAETGKEGLLVTDVPFADFQLQCDFRIARGGNSGVFLRTVFQPTSPAVDCYELNICDTHATHPTGSLVARKKADPLIRHEGQWQHFHVSVRGNRFRVALDGKPVLDFSDTSKNKRRMGFIGLQFREGKIEFRNVWLKPLLMRSLFNGKDFTGWTVIPGARGKFAVQENALRIHGVGNVQSAASFGDFVLQTEVRTNAANVNSGIFFRSMDGREGEAPNGYELQIHNGFDEGDRTKPNDYGTGFGTGAIFRFQKARRVIPNDREWFTMTLVAHGERLASWVNGYQVTNWKDTRPANENPRRGRRLKAGRLVLQGHDARTDVSFRHIRVGSLHGDNE